MGKIGEATVSGASGKEYDFDAYTLDTQFKNIGAVYIFTKRIVDADGDGIHTFLCIGETGDLADTIANREKQPCAKQHSVNCICVHADDNENSRKAKETDLRQAYKTPCNDE